ncbi:MAG: hypothetical protein QOC96_580 [Acidobacteriota bacterium]|jgi:membrane-associated phospholipid phosphatase|nr:hypothetical protein [Acidobacteriota bacterium]
MSRNITNRLKAWRAAVLCLFMALAAANAPAQEGPSASPLPEAQPTPTPQAQPSPTLESRFFANILHDQRAIWTSPFNLKRDDAKWLAPLGISTAIFFATDRRTSGELVENGDNQNRLRISRDISQGGTVYTDGGIAAAFYLVGRVGHNARARETGLLSAEALIDSGIVVEVLKTVTQRSRPTADQGRGDFYDGGSSFPSGHAISAWTLATVVAQEYKRHPLVQISAYSLAAAVSISRYTGRNHFLSDVLVGSAIGYGIGRYVYGAHHDPSLDTDSGTTKFKKTSKLIPLAAPCVSPAARTYGLALAWDF